MTASDCVILCGTRLLFKLLGILAVVLVEVSADLCSQSESRWHGQSDGGHFSEICTLSSEKILHLSSAIRLESEPEKDTSQNIPRTKTNCDKVPVRSCNMSIYFKLYSFCRINHSKCTPSISILLFVTHAVTPCHLQSRRPTLPWRKQNSNLDHLVNS